MADTTPAFADQRSAPPTSGAQSRAQTLSPIVWLYLICILLPFSVTFGTLSVTPTRILMLFVMVPLMLSIFAGRYGRVLPTDVLFTVHILWALAALAINSPARFVENIGATALEFLGGYAVGRAYIRTPEQFIALIKALLFFVALTLPVAIVESLTDRSFVLTMLKNAGLKTWVEVTGDARLGLFRAQTVFPHPIHYGLYTSVALSLTFIGLRTVATVSQRVLGCTVVCVSVFLSLSSGALLAMLLQIGLISWDMMLRNVARRWLLLLGLFVASYVIVDLISNRTPIKVLMTYATFSAHTAYYRAVIFEWGMINVWNSPIFGLGLRDWIRPGYMRSGSVDNFWLVMAMRYGIPAFAMIALGYADAIRRVGMRKLVPGSTVSNLRLAWMFTFLGLSFTLVTVHIWTSVYSFVFFMLGSGLWIASATSDDAPEPAPEPRRGPAFSRESIAAPHRVSADPTPRSGPPPKTYTRAHAAPATAPDAATPSRIPPDERAARATARYSRFAPEHNR